MNDKIIIDTTEPFYEQFKELGDLFEDNFISYGLLKQFRKFFSKQCFYELKLIKKAENRKIKRDFKQAKKAEKLELKQALKISKSIKKTIVVVKPLNADTSHVTDTASTNSTTANTKL